MAPLANADGLSGSPLKEWGAGEGALRSGPPLHQACWLHLPRSLEIVKYGDRMVNMAAPLPFYATPWRHTAILLPNEALELPYLAILWDPAKVPRNCQIWQSDCEYGRDAAILGNSVAAYSDPVA